MLDYLQKYNELTPELKEKISSPEVMAAITEIEKKYDISLASVVMRIMVRDISIVDLPKFFVFEYNLNGIQANELVDKLKEKVFFGVADYLGITAPRAGEASEAKNLDVYLENKKEEAGVRSSNFFFSPEDEEEVKELAKKLDNFSQKPPIKKDENIEKKVEKFLASVNINFSSEDLKNRLGNIISIYFKGIRNKVDTKQTMMKSVADGGLDLDDILSSRAIRLADKVNEDFNKKFIKSEFKNKKEKIELVNSSTEISEKKSSTVKLEDRDIPYDFKTLKSSLKNTTSEIKNQLKTVDDENKINEKETADSKPKSMDLHTLNLKLNPAPSLKPVSTNVFEKKLQTEKDKAVIDLNNKNEKYAKKITAPSGFKRKNISQPKQDVMGKVKMEDVKQMPKLTGPIDELREFDVINFRRLSKDADSAAKKILEKINFLEEESYAKRMEGIKAWRNSPINKLYLRIGQESIDNKTGVNAVIDKRIKENREYITEPEFNAVMDLNKNLRF